LQASNGTNSTAEQFFYSNGHEKESAPSNIQSQSKMNKKYIKVNKADKMNTQNIRTPMDYTMHDSLHDLHHLHQNMHPDARKHTEDGADHANSSSQNTINADLPRSQMRSGKGQSAL